MSAKADCVVLFGATGDLAYKKLYPALHALQERGKLDIPIIGIAGIPIPGIPIPGITPGIGWPMGIMPAMPPPPMAAICAIMPRAALGAT